jgi:hypothetical protein
MIWTLAAQLSLPLVLGVRYPDVRAVFSPDDYPVYMQQASQSGIVYTRTTVRGDASTQSCTVERSSGDPKLDAYTCAIIVKRANFVPAKWTDGTPVYGVIRLPITWFIGDSIPSDEAMLRLIIPDMELSVNHLPKGAHSIAFVSLMIAADENGRPVSCAEWAPPKGPHFPELVPMACQQVMTGLKLTPPLDEAAKPVRSVQSVSVHFKIDQ